MRALILTTSAMLLMACSSSSNGETLSSSQALESVNEASTNNQASQLSSASIDVATKFALGVDAQTALTQIAAYVANELPCASVALWGSELSIQYGANAASCVYDGLTFSGTQTISIDSISDTEVKLDHAWTNLSDGVVQLNGVAQVTWNATDAMRTVATNISWTRTWDGMKGQGSSNVTQSALAGDLTTGIVENGTRTWSDTQGEWDVVVHAVEERWTDPLPQAGSFDLVTSSGASASVAFARVNDATIAATIASGSKSFTFDVGATGQTTQ